MLEIFNYMLIYVLSKMIRLCKIQINAELPLQFVIGGKNVDQIVKKKHACYLHRKGTEMLGKFW